MKTAQYATLCFTCLLGIIPVAASAAPAPRPAVPLPSQLPGNTPAPAREYVISTDGAEVSDPKTGLIWRRCAEGMNWNGSTCAGDASKFTHEAALQRAASQASSTGIAWRLPNIKELVSIGYTERHSNYPAIDHKTFPATPAQWFWSSTLHDSYANHAWYLSFNFGGAGSNDRNNANYVRLVRSGHLAPPAVIVPVPASTPAAAIAPVPASPYVISTDGAEVTDHRTGLIWRRCVEGMNWNGSTCAGDASRFTHEEALQRAAAQASSTSIAWRLPNIKELSSLVHTGRRNPAIDTTAFPATPFYTQTWSATPVVSAPHSAWVCAFSYANLYGKGRHHTSYVRLLRGGQ